MPKLPDTYIHFENEITGEKKGWSLPTKVSAEGVFSIDLPAEFNEVYGSLQALKNKGLLAMSKRAAHLWQVQARELYLAVQTTRQLLHDLHKCEITTTEHLVYRFVSSLSYWQNPDGSIAAGGRDPAADTEHGTWKERRGKHDHSAREARDGGLFGLQAFHMLREVHTRPGIEKVHWKVWWLPSEWTREQINASARAQLHLWSPLKSAPDDPTCEHTRPAWTIKPYDDKMALFFAGILKRLCMVDNELCTFFDNDVLVERAIANGETAGNRLTQALIPAPECPPTS